MPEVIQTTEPFTEAVTESETEALKWEFLNIVFLLLAATLVWRYFQRGGGWAMLKMMNKPMDEGHQAHTGAHAH